MTQEQVIDPNLLEVDLDSIEDLPPFEVPPPGHYQLKLKLSTKKVNDKPVLEFAYEVVSQLEAASPDQDPPVIGAKFSEIAQLPKSLAYVKDKLTTLGEAFGTQKISEIVAGCQDIMVTAVIGHRVVRDGTEEKIYPKVKNLQVA